MPNPRPTLARLVLPSAAALSLVALAAPALALSPEEMIQKAEAACLDAAATQGWRKDLAKVVSTKALDTDKVEVVFDLTRDGTNTARLTCPYSVSQGVGNFGGLPDMSAPAAPVADAGTPVNRSKAWWLLLPIGLGLASWAALRGRNETVAPASYGGATYGGPTYGSTTAGHTVEANARDGLVEVRDHHDLTATVLRRVRNGDSIALTGVRRGDWLEVVNGGWVLDNDVRYDRATVRFT
jgi:hypothetical protein